MDKPLEKYLLVSDVDGTLINSDGVLPERNLKTISRFIELGGRFSIATGRCAESAVRYARMFPSVAPLIVCNGSQIYDPASGKTLWNASIDRKIIDYVAGVHRRFPTSCVEMYCHDGVWCTPVNRLAKWHLDYEHVSYKTASIDELCEMTGFKAIFVDEPENMKKIREFVKADGFDGVQFVISGEQYFEVLPKGCTKGSTLKKLAELLSIPDGCTMAIGDYYNDLELLRAADVSGVAAGAPADVMAEAGYVCCDCGEGAVADFIEKALCKYF